MADSRQPKHPTRRAATRREGEEKYRQLFESAADAIFIHDGAGRLLAVNEAACRQYGYGRDELLSMSVAGIDAPEHAVHAPERIAQLMAAGAIQFETRHRRRNGDVVAVDVNSRRIVWDGTPAVMSVCRDVTERRRAEEKLAHMHELMHYVISHAQSAIAVHDRDMRYIYVSDNYLKQYNVAEKDVIGRHHYEVFPDLPQKWRDVHQRVLRGAVEGKDEDPYVRADGSVDWTRWECRPWYEADGSIGGLIVYTEIITERKRVEERIRQSEQFVRNILDTVDEGFIVVDRDYRIVTANRAYCDQAALPAHEVIGRPCHAISHKADRPCHEDGEECAVRDVFATGEPRAVSHRHRDAEGRTLYVETKAFPVRDAAGTVVSAIETVNNITERHLLEEERLKSQKLESIGTLAGGIAHDFNNLLQGVFGYISMARLAHDERERSLAMLAQAEKALHQAVALTAQLLTFSKGGRPVRTVVDLRPVIENAARFALSGSRSDLRLEVAPDLRPVDADAGQIGQVVQNVVLNADQAMPLGGTVTIAARNVGAGDAGLPQTLARRDYVIVTIRDTGVGIAEPYLAKIFDPYFTTKEKGSGLGLATSYSIVRNHDGLIQAASAPGRGSVFTLYLPAAEASAAPPDAPAVPAARRRGRVLVMDDEDVVRAVTGELVAAIGHEPAFAADGAAAIAQYREARAAGRPFDVVILDLTVRGGMGGLETIERLREIDPAVKAVVSSGYSDESAAADFRARGFRAFLKKPYDVDELRRTLNALVG